MKKSLLFIALILSVGASAQNVKDQKVSFGYVQLPSNPISKGISNYKVVLDNSLYTKNNEDSLAAYEARLSQYEVNFEAWLMEKQKIDKLHYMNLATWEKSVNAGSTTAQMPVKAPYPAQPIKEEIRLPILTEDISEASMNSIAIDGYSKGDGGAVVTITPLGFQEAKILVKKSGTAATTKYTYTTSSKMAVKVVLSVPGQGDLISEVVNTGAQSKALKTYDNQYEHQVWLIDNYDTYWAGLQKGMLSAALVQANNMINDRCGFPIKNRATEIYTIKKHKGHNYSDLIDGYSNANAGYGMLSAGTDKKKAISKLAKAISIWEKALTESNINDSKSRVNKKVTGILYANIAEAYMWSDDFQQADNYAQKAILSGVLKAKSAGKKLKPVISGLKTRYLANN